MRVEWRLREPPLTAVAAAGHAAVGARLVARAAGPATCAGPWVVVDGLPWADGVVYLGRLPGAGDVLVPVHREPAAHPDLVMRAIRSLLPPGPLGRVALLPDGEGAVVIQLGRPG